jgi:hypothetical protein
MKMTVKHAKWLLTLVAFIIITTIVSSCAIIPNNPPVISSMQPAKSWVELSGRCQIECVASDPDGDELTYEWSANAGNIAGIGPIVNWIAPDARGLYMVTVVVTDGRGGEAKMNLPVLVSINQEPVIDSLAAEQTGCGSTDVVPIECIAYDPDGDQLEYTWEATGGTISAEGSIAVWTAPEEYDTYYITVTVTDSRGGQTEDEIHIRVSEASSGGG